MPELKVHTYEKRHACLMSDATLSVKQACDHKGTHGSRSQPDMEIWEEWLYFRFGI